MGVVEKGQTAAYRAEQIVGAATGARSAEESKAGLGHEARTDRVAATAAQNALIDKGNAVSEAQIVATRAVHGLNSAMKDLQSGIVPREEDPELAATQRAIKGKVSAMQSRLSTGLQVISAIGGASGLSAAAGSAATGAATEAFGGAMTELGQKALGALNPETIAKAVSEEWYREETNAIQAQIDQANAQSRAAAITANVSGVREAQTTLFGALQALQNRMTEYQQARDTLRTTLDNLGDAAAKQRGGEGYAVITGLLGDVAVLVTQIDTTIGLGKAEQLAAGHATEARENVVGTPGEQWGTREGGVIFFKPYQDFQLGNWGRTGGLVYRASEQRIYFRTSERSPGSAYGGEGAANPVVAQTMEELKEMRETAQGMRDVLSRSLGLTMQQ
jgi:hypothetical protein